MKLFLFLLFLFFASAKNYRADETPLPLQNLKVEEKIGSFMDTDIPFRDENGKEVLLKNYLGSPLIMSIVYYNCPTICNFHLEGLFTSLNSLKRKDFNLVLLSMDHTETSSLAFKKKQAFKKEFPSLNYEKVHFLTGEKDHIKAVSDSLGFKYRKDKNTGEYAHSPVAYALSPKGKITRYLYGVEFEKKTLNLAVVEASQEKLASIKDRILFFCYRFDPSQNKYSLYAVNIMKMGAGFFVLLFLSFLLPFWIKEIRYA